ncbi:MAG: hydantoinase/oxoprolinase N-terminal domain-containing protein [Steroidobacteraceae bacterium]
MRIGVDVGGTNTDAVLMDGRRLLAFHKHPTTPNVSDGIVGAIRAILRDDTGGERDPASIAAVMIGTTHFTNAFVERRNLSRVGVLRIALPAARGVPPLMDWPRDFVAAIGHNVYCVRGGYHYDGRINSPLDERAVAAAARQMKADGLTCAAVCGLFSPVSAAMEERAAQIIAEEAPQIAVTLSSRIGRIGIIERENAAIMNASLAAMAREVVAAFASALRALGIEAPFFISQNDGTLMSAERVAQYPVLTFASGPTNSMRGAAFLSGLSDALVADIGGTTTDIGMLVGGFPRESAVSADIGGVRTNFRMPDLLSIGLGGGSLVRTEALAVRVGPRSVGYRLAQMARVFGGPTLTASDIAVAAGYARMGEPARVADLDPALVKAGVAEIRRLFAEGLDRMKISAAAIPLVLVGGGAVLIQGDIPGVSQVIIPEAAGVANAIGASITQVGGEVDRVYSYQELGRDGAIAAATEQARQAALASGATTQSLRVVEVEELPLAYVPGGAVRLRVKVTGDLALADARETPAGQVRS